MADAPQMHDALLVPELAEVYLLLDNVSAVANKTLPDLDADPVFARLGGSWMEQVCAIRWPPDADAPQDESRNAARLIRAKDALNRAAWPATGASIAFTLMLAGETSGPRRRGWWQRLFGGSAPDEAEQPSFGNSRDRLCAGGPFSRVSLAALAYPTLYNGIGRSRATYRFLNWFLVVVLVLTCLLSWNVTTGSSLLNRVDSLLARQTQSAAIDRSSTTAEQAAPARQDGVASAEAAAREELETELRIPASNLIQWVEDNRWLAWLVGGFGQTPVYYAGENESDARSNLEWAAIFIGVLAGTVLPIFYGVLGASAAVVRSMAARMSANTLMPRDLVLALVQLALGAVLGACVGLFVTAPGDGAAAGPGLLGPVHLSGAALCFLAGFGVEGVFRALESLVAHVFPFGSAPSSVVAPAATPVAMPAASTAVAPPPAIRGVGRPEGGKAPES